MFTKILLRIAPLYLLKRFSTSLQKRAFFVREYQEMLRRMWRGEFVLAKKKEIREDIRREFDKTNEDLEATLNVVQKSNDATARENLEKIVESKKKDIAQFKEQIDQLDKEISDLNELLTGYREGLDLLKKMINE